MTRGHFHSHRCRCGERVTNNALGRAAHERGEIHTRAMWAAVSPGYSVLKSITLFCLRLGRVTP